MTRVEVDRVDTIPSVNTTHEALAAAEQRDPIRCAVLTVSDTRTIETDTGGALILRLLHQADHVVIDRAIVPDEAPAIEASIARWLDDRRIEVILTTGGTGIARRDVTIDVVRRFLTSELDGFGELFRTLSFAQVGAAAMLSRAIGGVAVRDRDTGGDTFIFAMPGSPKAVELAMSRLIVPQLPHLVWERRRM